MKRLNIPDAQGYRCPLHGLFFARVPRPIPDEVECEVIAECHRRARPTCFELFEIQVDNASDDLVEPATEALVEYPALPARRTMATEAALRVRRTAPFKTKDEASTDTCSPSKSCPLVIAVRKMIKAHDNCRYLWGPTSELHEALEALRMLVEPPAVAGPQ